MYTSLKKTSISPKQRKILNDLIRLGRIELERVPKDFRKAVSDTKKHYATILNEYDIIVYSKDFRLTFLDTIDNKEVLLKYGSIKWYCYLYHIASDTYLSKSIYNLLFDDINEANRYHELVDNIVFTPKRHVRP